MSDDLIMRREESFHLGRLQPQSIKELYWFGERVAKSTLFPNIKSAEEALLMMESGVELGLSPMQSLHELSVINGRVDIPSSVRAAKIASSSKVTIWDVDSDDERCILRAKRKDRDNECVVVVKAEDMSQADINKHRAHLSDWLYARAVRQISRRYFPDLNLGMETQDFERQVIDVRAVEKEAGVEDHGTHEGCGGTWYLQGRSDGAGVFLRCDKCSSTQAPPQEVRDAIRGRVSDFTETDEEKELWMASPISDDEVGEGEYVPLPAVEQELEKEEAKERWMQDIFNALAKGSKDGEPHKDHVFSLSTRGWDQKQRVKEWLPTLEPDIVEEIRNEVVPV